MLVETEEEADDDSRRAVVGFVLLELAPGLACVVGGFMEVGVVLVLRNLNDSMFREEGAKGLAETDVFGVVKADTNAVGAVVVQRETIAKNLAKGLIPSTNDQE